MLDPLLSLAWSLQSSKGVYALLLGSGVSRSAAIPTGWEIVLDLISKLARLQGEDCGDNPEEWFEKKFGESADYSKLLEQLANTSAERSLLLREYFEPTDSERSQRIKVPQQSHKAIAQMVKAGIIRVIVTPNFDRLLEHALQDEGVIPTVISSPDSADGALPLIHSPCTIIKIHGDYLDTRILNTKDELAKYDPRLDSLLDRVFDDYGLVICGWSAEWDTALRNALSRAKGRRFTTYWATRGVLSESAQTLATHRAAQIIQIVDADSFFKDLEEKIEALNDVDAPHPLSGKVAVATLKRCLPDPQNRIRVHELISNEVEAVLKKIQSKDIPMNIPFTPEALKSRLSQYDRSTEVLCAMLTNGVYWGSDDYQDLWARSVVRIGDVMQSRGGVEFWLNLMRYPLFRVLYSAGLAAVAAQKYRTLKIILSQPIMSDWSGAEKPLETELNPLSIDLRHLPEFKGQYTSLSNYLYKTLRDPFREIVPKDSDYDKAFDRFEYLFSLNAVNCKSYVTLGRFAWKRDNAEKWEVSREMTSMAAKEGSRWNVLQGGFFDGNVVDFQTAQKAVDERVEKTGWAWGR